MQRISNILKKIGKFIYTYKFSFVLLIYLCSITIIPNNYLSKPSIINAASFFLFINIISKTRYPFIFSLILGIFLSFDAYFAFYYHIRASIGIIASIFETNYAEAVSMTKDLWCMALLIFAITTILIFMAQKEWKEVKFSKKLSFLALLFYWIIFIPSTLYWKGIRIPEKDEESSTPFTYIVFGNLSEHFPLIYGDISALFTYKSELAKLKEYQHTMRVIRKDIILTDTINTPEKIFLVIGESSMREHYSLYGYALKTTPFLDSLSAADNSPLRHYEGLAAAPITRDALRLMLTFATVDNFEPFYKEKNIIDLANQNGYETIWISNHDLVGLYDSYIGFISSNAQRFFYEKTVERKDMNLIPALEKFYVKGKKQFFVIHLIGSHMQYRDHYDNIDKLAIPDNNTNTLDYDRSIHHTDRTLKEITNIAFRDSSSIVYYISDHGEIINTGHGYVSQGVKQFHIPLVTINNSRVPIDSIVNKYIDPSNKLIGETSTVYILSEILGYSIPQKDVEEVIKSGRYVFHADEKIYLYEDLKMRNP